MKLRSVDDRLREEYFSLLPEIRRVTEQLETEIRNCLLPVSLRLEKFERVLVKARIKECESALETLRRKQEGRIFDRDKAESYSLTALKDLAGVRVLVFPGRRIEEIKVALLAQYGSWTFDPVPGLDKGDEPLVS